MAIPVPHINPPPGPIEIEARRLHATVMRGRHPGITDREILDAWDRMENDACSRYLEDAVRRFEERLAHPAGPDESDKLRTRAAELRGEATR